MRRYRILRTPREESFDRIARLATDLFAAPIAAISFVEEDCLWFKTCIGIRCPTAPRAHSFSELTIQSEQPTVIHDVAEDGRFHDHPLSTGEAPVRFYAGAPLRTADGHALGALCILDREPRPDFDGKSRRMLQDLAALVMHEVESRELIVALQDEVDSHLRTEACLRQEIGRREKAEQALQKSSDHLGLALSLAGLGTWESQLPDGPMYWSARQKEIYAFPPGERITQAKFLARIHPDDRARIDGIQAQAQAPHGPGDYAAEFRIRWPDGTDRWLVAKGMVVFGGVDGTPVRMFGTTMDITGLKSAELELRSSLDQKNALLRELHHRVKNNLQTVWGMVQLEALRTRDIPEARERMEVIAQRLGILGALHQQIYGSDTVSCIALAPFLETLARNLVRLHGPPRDIRLELALDDFVCDIDTAIPLALLANELITNSLKHAFPGRNEGLIRVSMKPMPGAPVEIAVSDDGIGFPKLAHTDGIGLLMVQSLASQIDAEWRQEVASGTRTSILVPGARLRPAPEYAPPSPGA